MNVPLKPHSRITLLLILKHYLVVLRKIFTVLILIFVLLFYYKLNVKKFLKLKIRSLFYFKILSSKDGFHYLVLMNPLSHFPAYYNGIFIGHLIYFQNLDYKGLLEKIGRKINLFVIFNFITYFIIQIPIYFFAEDNLIYNAILFALLPLIVPLFIIISLNQFYTQNFENKISNFIFKIYQEYSVISFFTRMILFIYINQLSINKFFQMLVFIFLHPMSCIFIKNIFANK